VERDALNEALRSAVERSFNRVTVDGDTSPNDMALLMANGSAGNEPLTRESPEYGAFAAAVEAVAVSLAKEIARDGEGATKLIEVSVDGARDEAEAARLARSVAGSSLVKAAVFGEDANWGRVLTAMGYAGVPFDAEGVEISFGTGSGTVPVFAGGEPVEHDAAEANAAFANSEVRITAWLSEGAASATAWGCDLTHGYVEINGSYRT
jgi:glutamate N-acetyltransferase/amino-acid N-acetyltransferase